MGFAPENDHIRKHHVTSTKKESFVSNKLQLQKHSSTFIHKNLLLLSATSILFRWPKAYNTIVPLEKLACTDHADFGKKPRQNWTFFLCKKFQLLGCKTKSFQEKWQRRLPTGKKSKNGEADFNQFMRLRNQLVIQAEIVGTKEKLPPVQLPNCPKKWMNKPIWLTWWLR